ncbi:RusA family crossover junction endodeoxyribonuclease [Endozoicomonas ascidiicola]|uniref:RusA family crossover junction endodeoxyribonuclease n=1 Tax=Endozoicomonas ascidiicola TaxID=1698521 RepID=UPI000A94323F|nr:RusA family crossover junction endodeoxyribonuclease [Endozoicomonas ascidiicola]
MDTVENWFSTLPEYLKNELDLFTKVYDQSVFINTIPAGKGRPRFSRRGHCYTPEATKKAEQLAHYSGQQQRAGVLMTGQIGVLVLAVFPVPVSWSKKKQTAARAGIIRPAVKPDFDNVAKLYCDALNGIIWEDDKQIVDGRCIKIYGQRPGVLVLSWQL